MTFKTTKLRDAITLAIAVGSVAGTGAAFAQDTTTTTGSTQSAQELGRIEVTGSRIRKA